MIKPKEAITILWKDKFFKNYRDTDEVKRVTLSKYGCTCSNWSALLKSCNFLRRQKGQWVQKYNPIMEEDNIFYISGKKPWTDRNENFIKFLQKLKGEILIVDPYYGLDTLSILARFPKNKIRFITSQLGKEEKEELVKKEISRFKKEFKNINMGSYPKFYELHDRYIISENYFVVIGHGLKDFGNKECFLIAIPKKEIQEITNILENKFNERWKNSIRII